MTAGPITCVAVTSADMIVELVQALRQSGIELRFAEMKDPVKDKLERFELFERFGEENFHSMVGEAVDKYVEASAVDLKHRVPSAFARVT